VGLSINSANPGIGRIGNKEISGLVEGKAVENAVPELR
jgi:hypothetical protein